jgi:hypothetical protein
LTARLLAHSANTTLIQSADLSVQFWQTILTTYRPDHAGGCLMGKIGVAVGANCLLDWADTITDCSTLYAEGLSVLADITKNSTTQKL